MNVETIETAAREATARKEAADRDLATAIGNVEKQRQANAAAAAEAAQTTKKAGQVLGSARADADRILADARLQAEQIVARARQDGQKAAAEGDQAASTKRAEIANLDSEITKRRAELRQVQQDASGAIEKAAEAKAYLAGLAAK